MVTIKVYECLNKPATKKPQFCLHSPWDWWREGGELVKKMGTKNVLYQTLPNFM